MVRAFRKISNNCSLQMLCRPFHPLITAPADGSRSSLATALMWQYLVACYCYGSWSSRSSIYLLPLITCFDIGSVDQ